MNTTPSAPQFSLSNDNITAELDSLFLPDDVFNNTTDVNGLFANVNVTLKPLNKYIS